MAIEKLSKLQKGIILTQIHLDKLAERYISKKTWKNYTDDKSDLFFIAHITRSLIEKGILPNPSRARWEKHGHKFYLKNRKLIAEKMNVLTALELLKNTQRNRIRKRAVYRSLYRLEKNGFIFLKREGKRITKIILLKKLISKGRTMSIKKAYR